MGKKARIAILILIEILLSIPAFSQVKKIWVTGKVIDNKRKIPLHYASVSLLKITDSALIQRTHTNKKGEFYFYVSNKKGLLLEVSFVGYQERFIFLPLGKEKKQVELGEISLHPGLKKLETVTVTSQKNKMYKFQKDSTVFNVPKGFETGGSAKDVLAFTPSLTIGFDNQIKVKGQGNIKIYVNSKPISDLGMSVQDFLNNTPAFMIEKIMILNKPPDPEDAAKAELAGVTDRYYINILTRKIRYRGYNAAITAGLNTRGEKTGRMHFNTNLKPFRLTYSNNLQRNTDSSYKRRINFLENDDSTRLIQNAYHESTNFTQNLDASYNFQFTDKERLRLQTQLDWTYDKDEGQNNSQIFTSKNTPDQYRKQFNNSHSDRYGFSANADYKKEFDKKEKELSISANFNQHQTQNQHHSLGAYLIENDTINQVSKGDNRNRAFHTSIMYKNTFGSEKKHFYLVDGSFTWNERHNLNNVGKSDTSLSSEWLFKNKYLSTNTFYKNKSYSTFLLIGKHDKKLGWITGAAITYNLRNSHDDYRGSEVKNHKTSAVTGFGINYGVSEKQTISFHVTPEFQKYEQTVLANDSAQTHTYSYTSLIPDASIKYAVGNHQISFHYNRKTQQPSWQQLNPYVNNKDPLNIHTGNPNLRPAYTNEFKLRYKYNHESLYFSLNVEEDVTQNAISPYTSVDSNGVSTSSYINLDEGKRKSANLNTGYHYFKDISDWDAQINIDVGGGVSLYQQISDDIHVSEDFRNVTGFSGNFKVHTSFKFKILSLILKGTYFGPHYFTQGKRPAHFRSGLRMKAALLKHRLNLTFGIENLFGASVKDNFYKTDQYIQHSSDRKHVRYFSFYLTYNFKNYKKIEQEKKN